MIEREGGREAEVLGSEESCSGVWKKGEGEGDQFSEGEGEQFTEAFSPRCSCRALARSGDEHCHRQEE